MRAAAAVALGCWLGAMAVAGDTAPVGQVVTLLGRQVDLPGMRPQAVALPPDGRIFVTSGKTSEVVVIDPGTAEIRQRVKPPAEDVTAPPAADSDRNLKPDTRAIESYAGLVFSPDGRWLFMSNVHGSVKVFTVVEGLVTASHTIPLPPAKAPQRAAEITPNQHALATQFVLLDNTSCCGILSADDHTSGTTRGCPTPAACIADNDLAFGRIVEGLSKSRFWPKTAIFAIEDDPQAGWDHVSGYRTTCYVASPYAKRGVTVSTRYNTTSVLRTIGQILGLPPMNQFDASATPMVDCFTDEPNLTPFTSLPATVPLDQMNPDPKAILDPVLKAGALASAAMNFSEIDRAPEDVLNRVLWHAMKGGAAAYPEWATAPGDDDDEDDEPGE